VTFFGVLFFIEIFSTVLMVSLSKRFGVSLGSLYYYFFFTFSFSFPFTIHEGQRKNKEEKNKKTLKMYRGFDNDITSTLGKISMGRIQRHQESPSTVTGVGHTNRPKTSVPRHLWTTGVTHSIHH
jgi:hypothetical protein